MIKLEHMLMEEIILINPTFITYSSFFQNKIFLRLSLNLTWDEFLSSSPTAQTKRPPTLYSCCTASVVFWGTQFKFLPFFGYCLQCFLNSPPGENVNSFTTWWMIYLIREYLIIHLVVKVLTFSPDGDSYLLTIHLKVNCFHRSVKSRLSSSYCFVDWRGFIIHPEVN